MASAPLIEFRQVSKIYGRGEAEIRAMCKQLLKKDEAIDTLKKSVGILSKP